MSGDDKTIDTQSQPIAEIEQLIDELTNIRQEMIQFAAKAQPSLDELHPMHRESGRNLLHYLALRRHDLRPLQRQLASLGLSSLGRAESHVLASVEAVLKTLHRLAGRSPHLASLETAPIDFATGEKLLAQHTEALLGPATSGRAVRIMVTMAIEAANDYTFVHHLLEQGMDCMRINCAHDDKQAWLHMIEYLRSAEQSVGKACRISMDLAGPKLRTGPLEPGPAVLRIRPKRDVYGRVTVPAQVWLTSQESPQQPPSSADATLLLPKFWLSQLRRGECIRLRDARSAKRSFRITDVIEEGCWVESIKLLT